MKNLTPILYGVTLCTLLIFAIKLSTPDGPEGMALIPAGDGVDAFYMDVYEVTNAQYRKFIDENPQWEKDKALTSVVGDGYLSGWKGNMYPKGKANHPVVNVGWFAAKAYAEWAGKELPTETQWERAARGHLGRQKIPVGQRQTSQESQLQPLHPTAQVSETRRRKKSVVMHPTNTVYTTWRVTLKNGA